MLRDALATVLLAFALAGCTPRSARVADAAVGADDVGGHDSRPLSPDCSEAARWIYLVDGDHALLRYEPDSDVLAPIGTLACPTLASPFSMAVDRQANAYVLHSDHGIYQVSTVDASCRATDYARDQMGFEVFGMGFVSVAEGSEVEALFIAGGRTSDIGDGSATLGRIDLPSWTVASVGGVGGWPELTGTGVGELWGFFASSTPMVVRQLDKNDGSTLREIDVSSIDPEGVGGGRSWAFAFWGGRYYVFYQGTLDASTSIYRVTVETGEVEPVRTNIGYRVVGAGVSTCAPTILI